VWVVSLQPTNVLTCHQATHNACIDTACQVHLGSHNNRMTWLTELRLSCTAKVTMILQQ
jgi:hypothetical protein